MTMQTDYTPSGRGPQVIAVFSFFAALSTIFIALRTYCRAFLVKDFGLDDWTAVIGWLLFVFHAGFAIAGAHHGTGQHVELILPPTEIPVALKVSDSHIAHIKQVVEYDLMSYSYGGFVNHCMLFPICL